MPRFVILRHDPTEDSALPRHWDFLLEQDGVLRTWALAAEPNSLDSIAARQLPDHRLAYLDYEGEISDGRGTVARWDTGTYEIIADSDSELLVRMSGTLLRGRARLARDKTSPDGWRFQTTG